MLEFRDVTFSYGDEATPSLENVSLEIRKGETVVLCGESGCGKSTLLRLLAGLLKPASGELLIGGKKVEGASLERGVVFQDYGLFPWMTAGENILLALKQRFPGRTKQELKQTAINMLLEVGLEESVYKMLPKELSGGMKQRCAIAQAFSMDPPILLMDEPFGALDAVTRARLQDLVLKLWAQDNPKKTVFFVTHDVDEAMLLANRIIVLGQSPSSIIYECAIPEDGRPTRETQFENMEMLRMRTKLICQINRDVADHIE